MENYGRFWFCIREEHLDAMCCLRGDGIDTSSYVWIREEEKREARKFMESEKLHRFMTKMDV